MQRNKGAVSDGIAAFYLFFVQKKKNIKAKKTKKVANDIEKSHKDLRSIPKKSNNFECFALRIKITSVLVVLTKKMSDSPYFLQIEYNKELKKLEMVTNKCKIWKVKIKSKVPS